jgi:tRNA A-37 threonylcarbamoyl transferase component Bud32
VPKKAPPVPNIASDATVVGPDNLANTIAGGNASAHTQQSTAYGRLGTYELLEKLGEGGMGAVYKARHTKLGRIMAVKVLSHHALKDANAIARFEREMLAVGGIHHPNIVQAFDAGEANGVHYLAMEYVDGKDLQAHLEEKGPLSIVSACKVIQQAAKGMAAAHALGLVHRDLKPGNLFVTKTGQVKVLDLGLALVPSGENQAALTSNGSWFGTPDYMAPEQWESTHHVDARADLYALGCTLFCLLVGRPPYGTEVNATTASKMIAHSVNESPDLQVARPAVPQELALLYKRLMAKKPEDRLATAQELVEQLNPFVSKKESSGIKTPAPAAPLALVQNPHVNQVAALHQPPRRRYRTAIAASGGAAALFLLGVIIVTIVNKDGTKSSFRVAEGVETNVQAAPGSTVTITQEPAGDTAVPMDIRAVIRNVLEPGGCSVEINLPVNEQRSENRALNTPEDVDALPSAELRIVGVSLTGNAASESGLKAVSGIKSIKWLTVNECDSLSLEAFDAIGSLEELEDIFLNGCWYFDDDRLLKIIKLQKLHTASFWYNSLSDRGIALLNSFPNLRYAQLGGGKYSGIGLTNLKPMPFVESIFFFESKITDGALFDISRVFANARELSFSHTNISGSTLEQLASMRFLTRLELVQVPLNETAIGNLDRLEGLKVLNVWGAKLPRDAINEFCKKHPDCNVISETIPSDAKSGSWWLNHDAYMKTAITWDGVSPLTLEATVTPIDVAEGHLIGNLYAGGIGIFTRDEKWGIAMATQSGYVEVFSRVRLKLRSRSNVAGVFDGKKLALYLNGDEVASVPVESPAPSEHSIFVGSCPDEHGNARAPFRGAIESVRITAGALYSADYTVPENYKADTKTLLLLDSSKNPTGDIRDLSGNNVSIENVGVVRVE